MTRIDDISPAALLDAALHANTTRAVLVALAKAAWRRKRPVLFAQDLPQHLRRDVGLPPQARPPTDWSRLR